MLNYSYCIAWHNELQATYNIRDNLLQQRLIGQTVVDSQVCFQTLHYRLLVEHQHVERLALVGNLLQKCSCEVKTFSLQSLQTTASVLHL